MKFYSLTVTLLLIALVAFAQKTPSTLSKYKINGRVKSYKLSSFPLVEKFGEYAKGTPEGESLRESLQFDEMGYLVWFQNSDQYTTFKYDSQHNMIEKKIYWSAFTQTLRFVYDDRQQVIERKEYSDSGQLSQRQVYKYDSRGNKLEAFEYLDSKLLR